MADNASKTKQASTYKGYNNIIAVRIRELMKSSGTTQQELAENTGCSRQAIAQYADGSNAPNIDKLVSIAKYFDVSLDYLVGLSNARTADKDIQYICDYTGLNSKTIDELHSTLEMSQTGTTTDSSIVIDETNIKETAAAIVGSVKSSCKNFLDCINEFILDFNIQEMTDNISVYLELTKKLEIIKEQAGVHSILNSNVKDKQDFYLFKISKNIQDAVKDLYSKGGE